MTGNEVFLMVAIAAAVGASAAGLLVARGDAMDRRFDGLADWLVERAHWLYSSDQPWVVRRSERE